MGKYRAFVMLGVAILVALVATLLIMNWLRGTTRVKQVAPSETQEVAVAKLDMAWGTILYKEMVELKPYLKSTLPVGYFPNSDSLAGRVLISPIAANEPILASRLAPTTIQTGGVAAVVKERKRAIAVKVDQVIGVAGFIHPGNRVDVLVTVVTQKIPEPVTNTVLENILVLAAGPQVSTKGKEEKPTTVDVITLEVTPEEAEKLALAATEGRLQLALRNFGDSEHILTKGVTIPALLASYSSVEGITVPARGVGRVPKRKSVPVKASTPSEERSLPVKASIASGEKSTNSTNSDVPAPSKKPTFIVELIKGGKSSEVTFEGSE